MKFFRALFSWQMFLSVVLAIGLVLALWFLIFGWLDKYSNHGESIRMPDITEMNVNDAIKVVREKGLKFKVDSFRYDSTRSPNMIIEFYPYAGKKIKRGRTVYIKSNPQTWAKVQLPDVKDKSLRLAGLQLFSAGFKVGDTIYVKNIAKDAVLKVLYKGKEVKKGSLLPKYSVLDLVAGTGPTDAYMPNLVNLPFDRAKRLIMQYNFRLGNVNYVGEIRDTANANVFYQFPLAHEIYEEFNDVELWVSSEPIDSLSSYVKSLNIQYKVVSDEDSVTIEDYIEKSSRTSTSGLDRETRQSMGNDNIVDRMREEKKNRSNQTNNPTNQKGNARQKEERLDESDSLLQKFLQKNSN